MEKHFPAFSKHPKKTIVGVSLIVFILLAIPLTINLSQKQQNLNSKAATVGPSGEAMPVGDISGWHQIFTDDFTTDVPVGSFPSAVSSKWSAYPDGWQDTSKNGTYYSSKVVSVSGGVLKQYLHTENGVHMVSAISPKLPSGKGQLYGRYAIRFKADSVAGYKTAWLLWPDSETWPRDGEIDFPEGNLDKTISAFMHKQNATSGSDQDAYSTSATYGPWHTAVTEWGPNKTSFILDGITIGTSTSRIPNTSMHYVIQTETALDGTVPTNSAAGNVQIDWVALYAYSPSTTASPTSPTAPTPTPPTTPITTQSSPSITTNISNGQTLSGNYVWTATVTSGSATSVDFLIDGVLKFTELYSPYQYNGDPDGFLDTKTLSNGSHTLKVIANSGSGTGTASVSVTVNNSSPTPSPTNTPTPTPSPTPVPNSTTLRFNSVKLHGIGTGGDNSNPTSLGGTPIRVSRTLTVELIDGNGTSLPALSGTIIYKSATGDFGGDITSSSSVPSGSYLVKVKSPGYLKKQLTGIVNITSGTVNTLPSAVLVTGDINNDNSLSIADYNILIDCYSDLLPAKNCSDPAKKTSADLTDDGNVNASDYNLFLRELSVVSGN